MRPLFLLLLAPLVAGCATFKQSPMVVDTFCLSAKKRTWDPDADSISTMREAVVWNRTIDRRCGSKPT